MARFDRKVERTKKSFEFTQKRKLLKQTKMSLKRILLLNGSN